MTVLRFKQFRVKTEVKAGSDCHYQRVGYLDWKQFKPNLVCKQICYNENDYIRIFPVSSKEVDENHCSLKNFS